VGMTLSPERGETLDQMDHTRRVLNAGERDLAARLEWVAIDQHNRDTPPHVHVAIRGRDETGRPLLLDREYVKHGVQARSRELATQALGCRTEADRVWARAREVQRFGELDAVPEQCVGSGRLVPLEDAVPASARAAPLRLPLVGRLQFLGRRGRAPGPGGCRSSTGLRSARCRAWGTSGRASGGGDPAITDPAAARQPVRLEPRTALRGRVAGTAGASARSPFPVWSSATVGCCYSRRPPPWRSARKTEGSGGPGRDAPAAREGSRWAPSEIRERHTTRG